MTVTPVVNVTSQPRITPYISPAMFKNSGAGVAVSTLVPGANPQSQDAALASYIDRATAMIDDWLSTSLAASIDVDEGPINFHEGYWSFSPRYRPAVALLGFSIGIPGQLTAYPSLDGVTVTDSNIKIPAGPTGVWNSPQGPLQLGPSTAWPNRGYGRWTYANGFPITWLTQAEAAGATVIHVAETMNIISGATQLTIQAGESRFRFIAGTVSTADSSGFGQGAGTVVCPALPFDVPNNALYPTYVTGCPGSIIEAAILGTRALIKKRSSGNVSSPTTQGGNRQKNGDPLGYGDDLQEMYRLLNSYQVLVE